MYGDTVEVKVEDEDTQPLEEPIIAPITTKSFSVLEQSMPKTLASTEFMVSLMSSPALIRNVTIAGHLHHGKTLFCDTLIEQSHVESWDPEKEVRYTDSRKDEQERGVSIKSTPVSLVLPVSQLPCVCVCASVCVFVDVFPRPLVTPPFMITFAQSTTEKSYLLNLMDTPGHPNFCDEVTAALRISDGLVLVVDAVEGVMMGTENVIQQAVRAGVAITLVVAKVDRLIVELKLPPADAYYKLLHTIEAVNSCIAMAAQGRPYTRLDPVAGNVCFAASANAWCCSLESFAKMYVTHYARGKPLDHKRLAKRLWGDVWFDPATRKFVTAPPAPAEPGARTPPRSFVEFVLEPIYKVYAQVLGEEPEVLGKTLAALGVHLKRSELHLDPRPLLKLVFAGFLGRATGFVDMVVRHVKSPVANAAAKVQVAYGGPAIGAAADAMRRCDPAGPLMVNVVKLYNTPDATAFLALGRVMSGSLEPGQRVRVLGENYTADDDEDMAVRAVTTLSVGEARYRIDINRTVAGNWVLLEGVDDSIVKSATITQDDAAAAADVGIFKPLPFNTSAVMKLAVEPLNPSELPKVLSGLRQVQRTYPLVRTHVEESGEHVLFGTGELALDCAMHDLRVMYSEVEIKVADPVTAFCETVSEPSSFPCFAETPNKANQLTMLAEPLDDGLAADVELHGGSTVTPKSSDLFKDKYGWDVLEASSVWAFGPSPANGPNLLVDYTLPSTVDRGALGAVRDATVQGFQWACREGPLCDEPVRNVKFKLMDATVAADAISRGSGQIIPTARRVAYSAFLMAAPRLMEPVMECQVQSPADSVEAVYKVLARRRGHVTSDAPLPGSPFYVLRAMVPAMDSFGLETDLRVHTQGTAMVTQMFARFEICPGDPLDTSIVLRPLEPSPPPHLAHEFMIKTRRRKGLSESVVVSKFFDGAMLRKLAEPENAVHAEAFL